MSYRFFEILDIALFFNSYKYLSSLEWGLSINHDSIILDTDWWLRLYIAFFFLMIVNLSSIQFMRTIVSNPRGEGY